MNATPPVSQFQRSNEATQFNPAGSLDPASGGSNSDFAGALHDAGARPVRKGSTRRTGDNDQSGRPLPGAGNQPPSRPSVPPSAPVTARPATATPASAANSAAGGVAGSGVAGGASGGPAAPTVPVAQTLMAGRPLTVDAQGSAASAAGATTPSFGTVADAAAAAATAAAAAAQTSSAGVAASDASGAPVASAASAANAGVASLDAAASAASAAPAAAAAAAQAGSAATKMLDNGTTRPVENSASGKTSGLNDSSAAAPTTAAASGAGTMAADASAQAVMAAAAVARATNGSDSDASAPQDDLATPDTGVKAQDGVAAGVAMPPVVVAMAASRPAVAAAVGAAVANAQTIAALAGASAADRHVHNDAADLSLSGVSNDGSAGAAQLLSTTTSVEPTTAPTLKVAAPVDSSEFGQGVSDQVSFMVDRNMTSAKLQVNPPALGPIEVSIALQNGHAQVSFASHSALTRDALEASAPKLREMLGAQGFGQVSVDVSQGSYQDRSAQSSPYESSGAGGRSAVSSAAAQAGSSAAPRSVSGMLDAYA